MFYFCYLILALLQKSLPTERFQMMTGESTEYSNPSDQDQNPDLDLIHNQRHR